MKKLIYILLACVALIFSSCSNNKKPLLNQQLETKMNKISEAYVKLILRIGQYDPDYVDAYYGPAEWKPKEISDAEFDSLVFKDLDGKINNLLDGLDSLSKYKASDIEILRYSFLYKQMLAAKAKLFLLRGGTLTFDEETKALYDAKAPHFSPDHFQNIIDQLDKLLPGKGDIEIRWEKFRKNFIIPKDKISSVFNAAINECRKRTLDHIQLPAGENFKVEYVTDKPWGGYNWYKGNSFSLIQVNTDLPIYIDRAVDIAAHEGYPGHHVYNSLLEKHLVKDLGWMEFTIYPLFSPQSLIAEGTANFGIKVAFPGNSRVEFEKKILFPLAGLDTSKADLYYKVLDLTKDLDYAVNEAARSYLDGKSDKGETVSYLMKYGLMSKERAEHMLRFIEKYRSYVINYNLGQDLIRSYVIRKGGTNDNPELRWKIFAYLLSTPQTPSGLKNAINQMNKSEN